MNKGLKTIEDYKSYYEDSTREQILDDTYIDFIGYQNLAKEYSKLQQENRQLQDRNEKAIELIENVYNSLENIDRPIMFYEEILKILRGE